MLTVATVSACHGSFHRYAGDIEAHLRLFSALKFGVSLTNEV